MDKNFDELFDEFFDEFSKGKNKLEIETNKFIDLISDISNHNKGGEDTSEIETNLENKLGEPDSVTYYYEDGLFVEKSAWKQASGLVIRTIKQKKPFDGEKVLAPELLINEQLEIAIINEDYENAAILRDKIKKFKRQANKKLSLLVTNIKKSKD